LNEVKPIALPQRHFRKVMGFAAAQPILRAFACSSAAIAMSRVTVGKSSRNAFNEWPPSM
jgi:hypothetical protein